MTRRAVLLGLALLAGAACQQPSMVASPPSTLLPPGATTLPLLLATDQPTACRWDSADVPFASMRQAFAGAGTTAHSTVLTNLSGGLAVSARYVQCEAYAAAPPLALAYRSLPDSGAAPFPRLGNLWGSGNFRGHPEGLRYAASRSSLWLGSDWNASEIAELRALNAYTLVLTSINACETNDQDLPDAFYLTNISQPAATRGRLQSWPGAWRLDLTNPQVQAYQAQLMYCLVVYGGSGYGPHPGCLNATVPPMVFDGLFVDNVFMDDGAAVNSQDIYHNPFYPIDQATGQPMKDFNERWRSGMVAMIAAFRALMPSAVLDGHAMDVRDANITAQFNAISIGFTTPQIIEGLTPFTSGLQTYRDWMTLPAHAPRVTMVESAVRFQIGYGYGFDRDLETAIPRACINSHTAPPGTPMPGIGEACAPGTPPPPAGYLPPQTFLLARAEYRYMRFGLGFTLMEDGYFTHELGDSWHGMDWDFDELRFFLGAPLGNATQASVVGPPPPPPPPAIPLTEAWSLYVRSPSTSNASWALDPAVRPPVPGAPPSARVDVQGTAASSDGIDLSQLVAGLEAGAYQLSFWARASREGTPAHLNARKNGGDWHSFGLDQDITLGTQWAQYNVTFPCAPDGSLARLSWFLGSAAPLTSVWVNGPTLTGVALPPPVLTREFECGVVVLNGDAAPRAVALGAFSGLQRLAGQQAPLWQYFVDDNSSAFEAVSGAWTAGAWDSGYHWNATPTQEEVRPASGFYHHWAQGARTAPAGSSARFDLRVPSPGAYDVALWWPAAVPARSGWARAMRASITPGATAVTLDLSAQGGDSFFSVARGVQLAPGSALTLECPAGGGECVADAVLVESAARWNDGSAVGAQLTLQPMDAIVLQKTAGAPPHCSSGSGAAAAGGR